MGVPCAMSKVLSVWTLMLSSPPTAQIAARSDFRGWDKLTCMAVGDISLRGAFSAWAIELDQGVVEPWVACCQDVWTNCLAKNWHNIDKNIQRKSGRQGHISRWTHTSSLVWHELCHPSCGKPKRLRAAATTRCTAGVKVAMGGCTSTGWRYKGIEPSCELIQRILLACQLYLPPNPLLVTVLSCLSLDTNQARHWQTIVVHPDRLHPDSLIQLSFCWKTSDFTSFATVFSVTSYLCQQRPSVGDVMLPSWKIVIRSNLLSYFSCLATSSTLKRHTSIGTRALRISCITNRTLLRKTSNPT